MTTTENRFREASRRVRGKRKKTIKNNIMNI